MHRRKREQYSAFRIVLGIARDVLAGVILYYILHLPA
jgi:hypothetical protein